LRKLPKNNALQLVEAASSGDRSLVQSLLQQGVDVNGALIRQQVRVGCSDETLEQGAGDSMSENIDFDAIHRLIISTFGDEFVLRDDTGAVASTSAFEHVQRTA
jgi:hypothetical protein